MKPKCWNALVLPLGLTLVSVLFAGCGGGGGGSSPSPQTTPTPLTTPTPDAGGVVRGGNYTLTDLGTLDGFEDPVGFTANGAIVGNFSRSINNHFFSGTFLATPKSDLSGGTVTDITPAGFDTLAKFIHLTGVNRAGQAVGRIRGDGSGLSTGIQSDQAGVWDVNQGTAAVVTPLRLPDDGFGSGPQPLFSAEDISDDGIIAGEANSYGTGETNATLALGVAGNLVRPPLGDLGANFLPGGLDALGFRLTTPYQIIDGGIVVGDLNYTKGVVMGLERFNYHRAFLYKDGTFTDLGVPDGFTDSRAYRVNAAGQIVGEAQKVSAEPGQSEYGEGKAFVYQNGTFTLLGSIGDTPGSAPLAINNAGVIVGGMYTGDGSSISIGRIYSRAFLWKNGVMTDLNTQIAPNSDYVLIKAVDIDDAGRIAAVTIGPRGQRVVLLTPR